MVKKILILVLFIVLYRCEPTKPDYDIKKSDNRLVFGCLITSSDSLHYISIETTNLKNSKNQIEFSHDLLSFEMFKNNELVNSKLVMEKDSIPWGYQQFKYNYHTYFIENFLVGDKIKIFINHDDYETISGNTTIPDSVEMTTFKQDTVLYKLPEYFQIKWNESNLAEAYYVRLFLKAENNDSTDFEVELTSETYWELYKTSYSQLENYYNISKMDIENVMLNIIKRINRSINSEDDKITIQLNL